MIIIMMHQSLSYLLSQRTNKQINHQSLTKLRICQGITTLKKQSFMLKKAFQIESETLSQLSDPCFTYGQHIANELTKFDLQTLVYIKKAINNSFFFRWFDEIQTRLLSKLWPDTLKQSSKSNAGCSNFNGFLCHINTVYEASRVDSSGSSSSPSGFDITPSASYPSSYPPMQPVQPPMRSVQLPKISLSLPIQTSAVSSFDEFFRIGYQSD